MTPFKTKSEAEKAAAQNLISFAAAVYVPPLQAKSEHIPAGWYVSALKRLIGKEIN